MTEVRAVRGPQELAAALALRHAVFVDEQGVTVAEELDGRDAGALHLVAVAPGARRRGLATALLADAERRARAHGARRIALAAQTDALGLYERAGYQPYGERFLDAGIEHLMMEKSLSAA